MLPKYPLHHLTYLGTKFEVARSNCLRGDTFTRNVTDPRTDGRTDRRKTRTKHLQVCFDGVFKTYAKLSTHTCTVGTDCGEKNTQQIQHYGTGDSN